MSSTETIQHAAPPLAGSSTNSRVVVVVGNPRSGSRTARVGTFVGERIASILGAPEPTVVELADLADELLAAEHPRADELRERISWADVVVVATPVYKGAYTGLLKAFLDHFPGGHLRGVTAVPLVVSASPAHAVAGEVHLRPVLLEIGASVPVRSIALLEPQLTDLDGALEGWFAEHAAVLSSLREAALGGAAASAPGVSA